MKINTVGITIDDKRTSKYESLYMKSAAAAAVNKATTTLPKMTKYSLTTETAATRKRFFQTKLKEEQQAVPKSSP